MLEVSAGPAEDPDLSLALLSRQTTVRSSCHPLTASFSSWVGLMPEPPPSTTQTKEHQGRPQHESLSPVLQVRGQEARKSGGGTAGGVGADDGPPSRDQGGVQARSSTVGVGVHAEQS